MGISVKLNDIIVIYNAVTRVNSRRVWTRYTVVEVVFDQSDFQRYCKARYDAFLY